jgi:hypothetical protein
MPSTSTLSARSRATLALLALGLLSLSAWAIYTLFTSRAPILVWDFHPPWLGLRAMLREGRNPYGETVTAEIQGQMLGYAAPAGEDQYAFVYPLHLMVFVGPLALLPLPVAQAAWLTLLEASLFVLVLIGTRAVDWRPPAWLLALTILFAVGLYQDVWALILGQNSILVAALVACAWWSIRSERWRLAGVCLALATIKPQISFLIVPVFLLWAIYRRRWALATAFAVALGSLSLLPMLWVPGWPADWLAALGRYAGYTFFDPPLMMLLRSTWPAIVVAALLLIWTAWRWHRVGGRDDASLDWALAMVVVVGTLIAPRTTHANQAVLLLPLFVALRRVSRSGITALIETGLLVGLWLLDLATAPAINTSGHRVWQHAVIAPILPFSLAATLLALTPRTARKANHA